MLHSGSEGGRRGRRFAWKQTKHPKQSKCLFALRRTHLRGLNIEHALVWGMFETYFILPVSRLCTESKSCSYLSKTASFWAAEWSLGWGGSISYPGARWSTSVCCRNKSKPEGRMRRYPDMINMIPWMSVFKYSVDSHFLCFYIWIHINVPCLCNHDTQRSCKLHCKVFAAV